MSPPRGAPAWLQDQFRSWRGCPVRGEPLSAAPRSTATWLPGRCLAWRPLMSGCAGVKRNPAEKRDFFQSLNKRLFVRYHFCFWSFSMHEFKTAGILCQGLIIDGHPFVIAGPHTLLQPRHSPVQALRVPTHPSLPLLRVEPRAARPTPSDATGLRPRRLSALEQDCE